VTGFGRIPPVVAPLYTYDANKNVTGETTGGVMASYTWSAGQDAEDRLIDWDSNTGEGRDWDLTLVGDWEQFTKDPDGAGVLPADVQDRTHTDAHEIDLVDGTAAEHDAKGNMTDDAGAGGNSGGGGGNPREFTYDFDNQLASVEMPDGKVHSFTYDALGRRVSQKIDTGVMGGGPYETTVYVCSTHESGLGQVVAEYDAGQPASNPERHYVYGAYVDEPLVFLAPSAQPLAPTYYHRNRKYDIVGLTSSTGTVLERYAYTPYGEVTFLNAVGTVQVPHASPLGNPYLFTGQRYDAAPALHFFKGRYYDAGLGRFLNRDPLGYVDGMSLYVAPFAMRFSVDPSGFAWAGPSPEEEEAERLMHQYEENMRALAQDAGHEQGRPAVSLDAYVPLSADVPVMRADERDTVERTVSQYKQLIVEIWNNPPEARASNYSDQHVVNMEQMRDLIHDYIKPIGAGTADVAGDVADLATDPVGTFVENGQALGDLAFAIEQDPKGVIEAAGNDLVETMNDPRKRNRAVPGMIAAVLGARMGRKFEQWVHTPSVDVPRIDLTPDVGVRSANSTSRAPVRTAGTSGASNVNAQAALQSKLSALENAQHTAARTRTLPDGRIRYYEAETPARTAGPTRGASYVTEYNPQTGQVRSWMESYDHAGNVNRVHPKMINGQTVNAPHYPPTSKELGQ